MNNCLCKPETSKKIIIKESNRIGNGYKLFNTYFMNINKSINNSFMVSF